MPAYLNALIRISAMMAIVPFAMGWGTLVGTAVGFLSGWSMDLPYLDTFSLGASAGLICGIIIGTLLLAYVRKKEE